MRQMHCPICRSSRVHRSRHRSWTERLRQHFTDKLPIRCHQCGWRAWVSGWQPAAVPPAAPLLVRPISPQELDGLDPARDQGR